MLQVLFPKSFNQAGMNVLVTPFFVPSLAQSFNSLTACARTKVQIKLKKINEAEVLRACMCMRTRDDDGSSIDAPLQLATRVRPRAPPSIYPSIPVTKNSVTTYVRAVVNR